MNAETDKLRELFLAALKVPADERDAYLLAACAEDGDLRKRAKLLIRAHEELGTIAPSPQSPPSPTVDQPPPGELPGAVIGPYKLLEQIGEGGMGTVWMAEQKEPIQRRVAVKVIKAGMDSKQVLARFEAERQALALMDHPNIARVLDAGETPPAHAGGSPRPYFVMELVKGMPITKYCDNEHLSVRERLELFGDVCRAVQHAHQKGIIHRDLKPSNILIAPFDGKPVVKVIDFGVAKATGQRLTEATLFTGFGAVVGTPEYMSPEQAETNNQDIDTRSDIYSLGVLLYELLTGSTPLTRKRVKEAALLEVLRVIREEEPPRPSTRLSSTEELPSISAQRHTEPAKLTKLVRGELDWIVMKALEKERNRRYDTANSFAMDVQRYLADEPVQACPPSAAYRLRKFARRNKAALTTAALVGAALVAAVVVLAVSTVLIAQEKDRKEQALQQANEQRQQAADNLDQSQRRLFRAKVNEARSNRRSRGLSQRFESLKTLEEATRLARELGLPEEAFLELRNEVIACLALPDLRVSRELPDRFAGSAYTFDGNVERHVRDDGEGNYTIRRVADDAEVCQLRSGLKADWVWLSPDGRWLLLVRRRSEFRLYAVGGPEALPVPLDEPTLAAHAFSPDGREFAVAHPDGAISVYELPSGRRLRRLGAGPVPMHMAFDRGGRRLALACPELALVRDAQTGEVRAKFRHPASWPFVAWHPNGKTVATTGDDRVIRLWDVATGKPTVQMEGSKNVGINCAFNRAGDLLASNGWEGTLRLWDPRTGQQLFQIRAGTPVLGPFFVPDGRLLAADVGDGKLRLWEVAASTAYRTLVRDPILGKGNYGAVAVSPTGRFVVANMPDGLGFWDCRTGGPLDFLPIDGVGNIVVEPSGGLLTEGPGGPLRWPFRPDPKVPGLVRVGPPERLPLPPTLSRELACSPDGRVVAGCDPGGAGAVVWHRDRPRDLVRLTGHYDVRSVSVSRDGSWVATGSHWGTGAKVWDAATGKPAADLAPTQSEVSVRFSPDGKWLATSSGTGVCRLWSVGSWREGPSAGPAGRAIAFSHDSKLLAVETGQNSVRLIDPDTGKECARLEDPNQDRALFLTFSPDGTRLVANGEGQWLHVWDLRAIRAELAARGLDWGLPPNPPAEPADAPPARVAVDLGDLAGREKYSLILAFFPFHAEAYYQRGLVHLRLNQTQRAFSDFTLALTLKADHAGAYYQRALLHARQGRGTEAVADFTRSTALGAGNGDAFGEREPGWHTALDHNNLAWFLATHPDPKLRDPIRAVALAKKAVEAAPTEGLYWNTLGAAQYRAGDWKAAVAALKKSMELRQGGDAFDFFFLAMACERLGQKEQARKWYKQAALWVEKNGPALAKNPQYAEELRRFRAEAAELLEIKDREE
jgi:serine/threonine protein kinase/WD40 repeat protein/tetratricopeptide (TPR) repeat protein